MTEKFVLELLAELERAEQQLPSAQNLTRQLGCRMDD